MGPTETVSQLSVHELQAQAIRMQPQCLLDVEGGAHKGQLGEVPHKALALRGLLHEELQEALRDAPLVDEVAATVDLQSLLVLTSALQRVSVQYIYYRG